MEQIHKKSEYIQDHTISWRKDMIINIIASSHSFQKGRLEVDDDGYCFIVSGANFKDYFLSTDIISKCEAFEISTRVKWNEIAGKTELLIEYKS
jgi:hypothetical protein